MAQLGNIGESLDLLIRQGSTFGPYDVELVNEDGTPFDLTGAVFRAKVKKTFADPVERMNLAVDITDAPNGKFSFGLDATSTAGLEAGDTIKDPLSQYKWDMEFEFPDGIVVPLYYGNFKVFREISTNAP